MGKFLEAAAHDESDIHFLQQLAEIASRSQGRLIVVGILHQAFGEYAHRLARAGRDEWSKIQGRFVDLAVNVTGDEQVDLIGKAIQNGRGEVRPSPLAQGVAGLARGAAGSGLPQRLENCWPLHPLTACLLGPLSRRRFGQNQRSIFGFLNSTEPRGFQDFLGHADDGEIYTAERLWDYLRVNLEPSIMASPDGHRWAVAVDALDRCEAAGGGDTELRTLKTIALVDLLKDRSGLTAGAELLRHALHRDKPRAIKQALANLKQRSLVVYRKFSKAWSVFEGSDFDIDGALERALAAADALDFGRLNALAGAQPVVAKRHYHETGALRWLDVTVAPLAGLERASADHPTGGGSFGAFFLALPEGGGRESTAQVTCRRVAAGAAPGRDVVVGLPGEASAAITSLARELLALEQVRRETAELQGDRVARNEIDARISETQGRIEAALSRAFDTAAWYRRGRKPEVLSRPELNRLASDLADKRFPRAPRLRNELLNRIKPSSSAVAAQKALLRRMVSNEGEARLGIDGFPPEGGLFESLLRATALYRETAEGWRLAEPAPDRDPGRLAPAWEAATAFLRDNAHRTVALGELYTVWRSAPYGIRDGLLPVLAVAFILSRQSHLAFYRQGIFQARLSELDVDYLTNDPNDIQVRWMDLSDGMRRLLSAMAAIVREMDDSNRLVHLEPIDVARGLVAIHDQAPPWTARTQRLSANAKRVRQLFKQAHDPNGLLFDDIPRVLGDGGGRDGSGPGGEEPDGRQQDANGDANNRAALERIAENMRQGLTELREAYPAMLHRLREILLAELQTPNASAAMLAELRARAENVRQLGGDHRLEAFVLRLARFHGTGDDMESLASMAVHKPARTWVDVDVDRASVALAELARQFNHAEAFAHVKGRSDKRHAMAVVVGAGAGAAPAFDAFDITDLERDGVEHLVAALDVTLGGSGEGRRNVILAALGELSARFLRDKPAEADPTEHRGGTNHRGEANGDTRDAESLTEAIRNDPGDAMKREGGHASEEERIKDTREGRTVP